MFLVAKFEHMPEKKIRALRIQRINLLLDKDNDNSLLRNVSNEQQA